MSNSRLQNLCKPTTGTNQTIGFRFHTSEEELQELQAEQEPTDKYNNDVIDVKLKPPLVTSDILETAKTDEDKTEAVGDTVRDYWHLLGRRSTSVDSTYESPFSNPTETWRKLSELKGKITKTVEEKISEMKMDRNVLGKSGRAKLYNSKDNSSISDSEDTSESSKLSEQWKDAEELSSSPKKLISKNADIVSNSNEKDEDDVKTESKVQEAESEMRNRKTAKVSDLLKLPDIKIATAKSEVENSTTEGSLIGEVESGVEADENLDPTDTDSLELFDDATINFSGGGGSRTPPSGGNDILLKLLETLPSLFLSQTYAVLIFIGFCVYISFPLTDFTKGFLFCFVLVFLWTSIKSFVLGEDSSSSQARSFVIPDYKSLPPLKVPEYKPVKGVWINEYERELYDPDYYSVTYTVPAYLELENNFLKLSRPKGKINRRATYDEPEYKLQFISQRIYNITGCNVYLMPEGLTRKRLFSKKYPIVIFLKPDSLVSMKFKGKDNEDPQDAPDQEEVTSPSAEFFRNKTSLYLFARCDRQKEEWYRRLLSASRQSSPTPEKFLKEELPKEKESADDSPVKEAHTPFENLFFDDDLAQIEEYLRYMAKFVDTGVIHTEEVKAEKQHHSWYKKLKSKKKDFPVPAPEDDLEHTKPVALGKKTKSSRTSVDFELSEETEHEEVVYPSLQVQWFNAFINRILFDVFRSPYWLNKIHEKIQKKLNSIRMPYYIEDIEVIEMDLGKTGPMFHRASQPYMDDRGLWFDMDTTFDGLIKLTIQTHLNLVKLQKGMEEESCMLQPDGKPEEGKKRQKELREAFLMKESKEKSKGYLKRKSRKLGKEPSCSNEYSVKSDLGEPSKVENYESDLEDNSNTKLPDTESDVDSKSSVESELIDEVEQLAEIAVEESIAGSVEKDAKDVTNSNVTNKSKGPGSNAIKKQKPRSPIYDSEVEDSAESSDEDEDEVEEMHSPPVQSPPELEEVPVSTARRYPKNRRSSKRIFRVFENVAQSKYFKSVAQSKYIQKAIAGVSATKLRLTIEIKNITGTLAVNIPPPPSDRFWYGFRDMPKLSLSANPKIGEKALRFAHIKNYLQKKILHELKKVMVVPNMIDFVLPTSSPARSSSSLQIEQADMDTEHEATPSE